MSAFSNSSSKLELGEAEESIVVRYEFERGKRIIPFVEIDRFLSEVPNEKRDALICELACVDLERRFDDSLECTTSPFLVHYSETFSKEFWRREIAAEHLRLSQHVGQNASRQEVAALYSVAPKCLDVSLRAENRRSVHYPKPGETFCGYPLLAELGRGGIARVFLARQPDLAKRLVVLKITEQTTLEAESLASLQHSNIVPVYSIHHEADLYGICMPFLGILTVADLIANRNGSHVSPESQESSGQMISTVVANRFSTIRIAEPIAEPEAAPNIAERRASITSGSNSPLSHFSLNDVFEELGGEQLTETLTNLLVGHSKTSIAIEIISDVVDGIAYSHSLGITHCDIKPENILIANDGRSILLDFNLAIRDGEQIPLLVGGTIPYMSPQRLRSFKSNGAGEPSDDVFAIGVVLYQLLTNQLPHKHDNSGMQDMNQLASYKEKPPVRPRQLERLISPSLENIVLRCLAPAPKERYLSAVELKEDITRYREDRVLRYAADSSPAERVKKFVRRHPLLTSNSFLASIAIALVALLIATTLWSADRTQRLTAIALARNLSQESPPIIAKLHAPSLDEQILQDGLLESKQVLKEWDISEKGISPNSLLNKLGTPDVDRAKKELGYILFTLASAEANLGLLFHNESDQRLRSSFAWASVAVQVDPSLMPAVEFQNVQVAEASNQKPPEFSPSLTTKTQPSLLGKMLVARKQNDWPEWQRLADEIVTQNPSDPICWFNLGSAFYCSGKWDRAMGCYDVSARLQSESAQAVFWRGVCRLQGGDFSNASQDFSVCLSANPAWVAARFNRAVAFQKAARLEDALADLDTLIEHNKKIGTRVWVLRSQIRFALGRRELANADRQIALTIEPIDANDWTSLGLLQLASEPEKSLRSFERAIELEPSNFAAMQNSVHVLSERLDRTEEAITMLTAMAKLRPKEASIIATRGILAARCGKTQFAIEDATLAGTLNPSPLEQLQIAGIHAMLGNLQLSIQWLNKALLADPRLANVAASDSDLVNVRNEERFNLAIENAKKLISSSK